MNRFLSVGLLGAVLLGGGAAPALQAETGQDAWLRYAPLETVARAKYETLPAAVVVPEDSAVLTAARDEMVRGVIGMMGRTLRLDGSVKEKAIILGTINAIRKIVPGFESPKPLEGDGFLLASRRVHGFDCIIITSTTERGVLYGVFAFLSKMARGENVTALDQCKSAPGPDSLGGSMGQPEWHD